LLRWYHAAVGIADDLCGHQVCTTRITSSVPEAAALWPPFAGRAEVDELSVGERTGDFAGEGPGPVQLAQVKVGLSPIPSGLRLMRSRRLPASAMARIRAACARPSASC